MASILGIGNATLDIIHRVAHYPEENEEMRCSARVVRRGGNAANTLDVLSQLGHACSWAGVLVDNAEGRFIRDDLESIGVDTVNSPLVDSGCVPVSTVIVNEDNGSRTIVHHRDLPEFSADDFEALNPARYDWLHFEGRNIDQLHKMLCRFHERYSSVPVSLEIEKPRPGIESLFGFADVLVFSRAYACHHGYDDPAALLQEIHGQCPRADLFCSWGEDGAVAMDRHGQLWSQTAIVPKRVVETLGAGDTFNAAIIHGRLVCLDMAGLLRVACALAGKKCGQAGFRGLSQDTPIT